MASETTSCLAMSPFVYSPGYYTVFFYDPDGIKVEVMSRPRLRTALWALRPSTTPFRAANRGRPR